MSEKNTSWFSLDWVLGIWERLLLAIICCLIEVQLYIQQNMAIWNMYRSMFCFVLEMLSSHRTQVGLELTVQLRLASNSEHSSCISLSAGIIGSSCLLTEGLLHARQVFSHELSSQPLMNFGKRVYPCIMAWIWLTCVSLKVHALGEWSTVWVHGGGLNRRCSYQLETWPPQGWMWMFLEVLMVL